MKPLELLVSIEKSATQKLRVMLPMDREVWRAMIHGVAKSWTQLSDWTELMFYLVYILRASIPGNQSFRTIFKDVREEPVYIDFATKTRYLEHHRLQITKEKPYMSS